MVRERQRARLEERLERLGESSLDSESLQREVVAALRGVIGFDRWCWPLADPETLLPLSGLAEHDYGPHLPRALELEFSGGDVAAKHVVARRATPVGSVHAETGGDPARSPRWDEVLRPVGIGDVAAVACRDALGCWGWIELYRDQADRPFRPDELRLLAGVARSLGAALRRRVMPAADGTVRVQRPPGVVVLGSDLGLVSWTEAARAWIEVLPAAQLFAAWGILPPMAYPAATLARAGTAAQAHALSRAVDGSWVMIDAAPLEGGDEGKIALTLRSATAGETFDLLCRAHGLTRRERHVVALLVAGLDTRAVAQRLSISRYTVQDHLKAVFTKTGVRSRRELVARLSPDDAAG